MKKQFLTFSSLGILLLAMALVFNSCKKDREVYDSTPSQQFDNSQMTNATFLGQIIREDGTPLSGAMVSTGAHQMTTDADGFFFFSNISTSLNATVIKVESQGYFDAYRTIRVIPNEDNQVRIMIMDLPAAQSFTASTGGVVSIPNGGSINFPTDAIMDANTNQAYTGNVNVFAKWIDPTSSDLGLLMPGALRGIATNGAEQDLTTYGMQAVELRGDAGQELQLATGKRALVHFPIPVGQQGTAPQNVPFWSLNETNGMWVEEGNATRIGNEYIGEASHFSFWNCDYGGAIVNFTCQLVDANNNPLSGAIVKLIPQASTITPRSTMSNSNGSVSGGIPVNTTFNLEYAGQGCPWNAPTTFIQSFSSTTTNVNLGTITVAALTNNPAVINGTVQDCNSAILANAPVKLVFGSTVVMTTTNATGQFSFAANCLSGTTSATVTAYDVTNAVNGSSVVSLVPNTTTNVGTVAACGTLNQFINWSSNDGTTTTNASILEGVNNASFFQSYQFSTAITATDSNIVGGQVISFDFNGTQSTTGPHVMQSYYDHLDVSTTQTLVGTPNVTITNYQAVGGWIEGSFIATVTSGTIPSRTVNGSFRILRQM